jgi:hypothetical protein
MPLPGMSQHRATRLAMLGPKVLNQGTPQTNPFAAIHGGLFYRPRKIGVEPSAFRRCGFHPRGRAILVRRRTRTSMAVERPLEQTMSSRHSDATAHT